MPPNDRAQRNKGCAVSRPRLHADKKEPELIDIFDNFASDEVLRHRSLNAVAGPARGEAPAGSAGWPRALRDQDEAGWSRLLSSTQRWLRGPEPGGGVLPARACPKVRLRSDCSRVGSLVDLSSFRVCRRSGPGGYDSPYRSGAWTNGGLPPIR